MRQLIVCLTCLLCLSGCSSLQPQDGLIARSSELLSKAGERISQQARAVGNQGSAQNTAQYDRELAALFDQPYIAPLTHYLDQHGSDPSRSAHLRQVVEERQRRCRQVALRYAERDKTNENLQQMRASYADSCPAEIAAFAAQIKPVATSERPTPSQATPTGKGSPKTTSAGIEQANECYLLFTIKNYSQARDACLAPAEAGDGKAQYNLSVIASSLKKYAEALHWARRAAEQSPDGRYQLGQLYLRGQGVEQNPATALSWFDQAADQGLARAQYQSARMYQRGQGVAANPIKARQRFEQAARQGHREAQLELGLIYLEGKGVAASNDKAHDWLLRAARQGSAAAQYQLGELYAEGRGVAANAAAAYVWISLARDNGEPRAEARLQQLRTQLDEGQIAQAQAQVRRALDQR
ncbi:tetratricopeptide repeat protein [Ectopseudomonas hydrolytica]|uniref:tetratricopeptide repeat protein n=1 Tax=Ectopseudomonas hydrolytica TaxID=2493633 RepID=UPI00376F15A1